LKRKVIENIFGTALYLIQAVNYTALLHKEAVTHAGLVPTNENVLQMEL
jgi:hypothetical protein